MKTQAGWKIIEVGPRIGGYRHEIYGLSYGINHIVNDVLNRGGQDPVIPNSVKTHTAVLNIYAREEGILASISGLDAVKRLESLEWIKQGIEQGELAQFAKNNGDPVLHVLLSNINPQRLAADIRRFEQLIDIRVYSLLLAAT